MRVREKGIRKNHLTEVELIMLESLILLIGLMIGGRLCPIAVSCAAQRQTF